MMLRERLQKAWYRAVTYRVPRWRRTPDEIAEAGFTSQDGQDLFVFERLGGKTNGVFFEVGAFDGVTFSNTCALERRFGWTGIAVEPSPTAFARLRSNRACTVVNGCIASAPGTALYLHIEGCAAMLSGIVSGYDARHVARIDREMRAGGGERRELHMPCFTIEGLASGHGITRIDYLSIDTEGGELAILESVDFSRLDVNLITVENNYGDRRFRAVLGRSGFRLIAKIARDEVYQHTRYLPQASTATAGCR
ncbi:MAG: FkbM family methyltransferase [Planctomycetia bacterium]